MKKIIFIFVFILLFSGCVSNTQTQPTTNVQMSDQQVATTPSSQTSEQQPTTATSTNVSPQLSQIVAPISRYSERITKKPFGIKITPATSPVQPEKFSGYHTGTDFEIFPEELNADVQIFAICDGPLVVKKFATGYGGVAVQACTINNSDITVVYGHLKLTSIQAQIGDILNKNDKLGLLGNAYSGETDGERKHLHLGIHKGKGINILGYVQSQKELDGWMNFEDLI
jgi:murein DD-endopeptidase MepM/ murein hydrolase activator NlpD